MTQISLQRIHNTLNNDEILFSLITDINSLDNSSSNNIIENFDLPIVILYKDIRIAIFKFFKYNEYSNDQNNINSTFLMYNCEIVFFKKFPIGDMDIFLNNNSYLVLSKTIDNNTTKYENILYVNEQF